MHLNEEQNIAANHIKGPCLVVAVPGSGKTRVITERVARLSKQHISERQILNITFTNKAANEMKERICERLQVKTPQCFVGTFHALCVRLLRKFGDCLGYDPGFSIIDSDDQFDLINQVARGKGYKIERGEIYSVANGINNFRESLLDNDDELLEMLGGREYLLEIALAYEESLHKNNSIDFSGLLSESVKVLYENDKVLKKVQKRWDFVQIDEIQDTNYAQFELAEQMTGQHHNLFLVGDPDQSVYAWRGARIENIDDYIEKHNDCKIVHLHMNYRSTPEIIKVAGNLIKHNDKRLGDELKTDNKSGPDVKTFVYEHQLDEADVIAKQIKILINKGYGPENIVVLYRMNSMSEPIEQALTQHGIGYVVIGGRSFYSRKEIKDCLAMLRLAANPRDGVSFHRFCATQKGIGDVTVGKIENIAEKEGISIIDACKRMATNSKSIKMKKALGRVLEAYNTIEPETPVASAADHLINALHYQNYLEKHYPTEYQERLNNVQQLIDAAANYSSINKYLQMVALITSIDKEAPQDKVSLMTIHAAKGLEFPIVIIIGVEEEILPHRMTIMDNPETGVEEERRLCYVGMTRAQKLLIISHCKQRKKFSKRTGIFFKSCTPSRFLYEAGLIVRKK